MELLPICAVITLVLWQDVSSSCDRKYRDVTLPGTHTACLSRSRNLVKHIPINRRRRKEIVAAHNHFRKAEHATDMLEMSWDNELAMLAEKWASTCPSCHDQLPLREAIGRFPTGQNIYFTNSSRLSFCGAVKAWADEKKDFTFGGQPTGVVGHYTQVVWSKTFKVGCAAVLCKNNLVIFICDYGPFGNISPNQYKPYTPGRDCSSCPGHCRGGLCDCGGKECLNGGKLDLGTCNCKCYKNLPCFKGTTCELDCRKAVDEPFCLLAGKQSCAVYQNVPYDCPRMCGKC